MVGLAADLLLLGVGLRFAVACMHVRGGCDGMGAGVGVGLGKKGREE